MPKIFILAIEDDLRMQDAFRLWIKQIDDESFLQICDSVEEAKKYLSEIVYDIIFLDLHIKDSQGIETFHRIKSICPQTTAIILLTGTDISETTWRQIGADGYIQKTSLTKQEVIEKVKAFLRLKSLTSMVCHAEHITGKLNAQGKSNGFTI